MRTFRPLFAALLLALTSLVGVATAQQSGGELTFGVNREADMLDLQVGSSRYDLVPAAQIFDTYLFLSAEGEFIPWLAEEVTVNDDSTEYTIRLRPGVTFHDGTPLDAEAVKFNFDRIVDPATQSAKAVGEMGPYDRTEVVDDLTAVVHFDASYPGFLAAIADWRSGGPNSPTAIRADPEGYRFAPVGTGPFRFVEWVQGSRIVLERNPDYAWPRPQTMHDGPAYLDRVVFRTIAEDGSRVVALRNGEIDGLLRLPPQELAGFENDGNFTVNRATLPGSGVILVVNASKPPTNDLAFRQALLHVVSPDQIARVGYFGAWPAHRGSVLSESNPGFIDLAGTFEFNPERAAQLLDEGGWVMGNDGVRVKDGNRAELVYIGFPSGETTRTLELIQSLLQPLGVRVQIMELESGAIQRARQAGDHHIAHLTFIYTDAHFLRTLFHSENIGTGWNFIQEPDSTLDGMLEAVQIEADPDARAALAGEIQRYMLEQGYVLPTVFQHTINVFGNHVVGAESYPVYGEAPYFYDTYLD
ncbi:MAG: ABC transporter substrate-binding protein [Trueperaceae bacterium]|nr:ABC transporter substrate-binding protein [Trueperaceae bacterium]